MPSLSESWPAGAPSANELRAALQAEFKRLGIDPDKVAAKAPEGKGNLVFDLKAEVLPGGPPFAVRLTWTERALGDYDQNGEVNIADLTPLGVNFGMGALYDEPQLHGGVVYWPSGDPDSEGALNWRLARIDGDCNGEINIADITPIAQHWQQRISGYHIYAKSPTDSAPVLFDDWARHNTPDQQDPVRYSFDVQQGDDGAYRYKIVAYDEGNNDESPLYSEIVVRIGPPEAAFTAMPLEGATPLLVTFDASTSKDHDGAIVEYAWDFEGDGSFDSFGGSSMAQHTYVNEGVETLYFDPVLRVTDNDNRTDTVRLSEMLLPEIKVSSEEPPTNEVPLAQLSADQTDWDAPPAEVVFDATASTDADGTIVNYEFDFDSDGTYDQSGSSPAAIHEYTVNGSFTATLRVTDDDGAANDNSATVTISIGHPPTADLQVDPTGGNGPLKVTLDGSGSYDPNGQLTHFYWDFDGDGTFDQDSGTTGIIQHTYDPAADGKVQPWNYEPRLRVVDDDGLDDTAPNPGAEIPVHVNQPPVASFTADKRTCNAPLAVQFDASASTDGGDNGGAVTFQWDWEGDGIWDLDSGATPNPTHSYDVPGDYNPQLLVKDGGDETAQAQLPSPPVGIHVNYPPTADLSCDVQSGNAVLPVNFDASGSADQDGTITKYEWDWDYDGANFTVDLDSGTDAALSHSFNGPPWGDITVAVRVSDSHTDDGGTPQPARDIATVTLTLYSLPVASLTNTPDPPAGDAPLTVSFDASASYDPDDGSEPGVGITKYEFDFGEGTGWEDYGITAMTQHEYAAPGNYTAKLRVTDNEESTDEPIIVLVDVTLAMPQNFLATDGDYLDKIRLIWTKSPAAEGYRLYRDSETNLIATLGDVANWDDTTVGDNADHSYWLEATRDSYVSDKASDTGYMNAAPVAVLSAEPNSGASPLTASFDASASTDDRQLLYQWDFDGDGLFEFPDDGPNSDPIVLHTYDNGGAYTATVQVIDVNGLTATASVAIDVDLWVHTWGGSGDDTAAAIDLDSSESVWATGAWDQGSPSNANCILMQYSRSGSLQLATGWDYPFAQYGKCLTIDPLDDIHVAGACNFSNDGDTADVLYIKYLHSGALAWTKSWEGPSEAPGDNGIGDSAYDITHDEFGNIYIVGQCNSPSNNGDCFLLKYTAAGNLQWQKIWNGYGNTADRGEAVELAGDLSVFVLDMSGVTILLKLTGSGGLDWQKSYLADGGWFEPEDFSLDNSGNVIIVGTYGEQVIIFKLTSGGTPLWGYLLDSGSQNDHVSTVKVDGNDNIYILTSSTTPTKHAVLVLDPDGSFIKQKQWVPNTTSGYNMVLSPEGLVLLAGGAPSANLSWNQGAWSAQEVVITSSAVEGALTNVTGTSTDLDGVSYSPSGTEDVGGGNEDVMVAKQAL